MQLPPVPADEAERVGLLRRLDILDTAQEQQFDDLVNLAAQWCEAPIALVSLVDADRQWFKARTGLPTRQTGRAESFCAHVVADGRPLVVEDTLTDPRFWDNPLVLGEPEIRFYAGMPLTLSGGHTLGTLCVIDRQCRVLSGEQTSALERLARQVTHLLETRRALLELRDEARDISRREALLSEGMAAAGEALWDWNVERGVLNNAISHGGLLGYPPGDRHLELSAWTDLIHPEDVMPAWHAIVAHLKGRAPFYEADYRMRHALGHWIWVRSRGKVVERQPDGRAVRMIGTVADITIRKQLEEQVRELNAQLAKETERAKSLAEDKTRFLATMAHEIRTPLNSIVGASRLALETPPGDDQADNLALVHDAALQLARLVDGILDFSKLEAKGVELSFSGVNLAGLLRRLQELFRVQAQVRGLSFRCSLDEQMPPLIRADLMRLEQVLCNLLGNAFKFTEHGTVRLDVSREDDARLGPRVVFTVSDSGVGIAPGQLKHLFTEFTQADDAIARQYGGTGLGLAISRRMARLMGGDVTLSSTPGQGTTARLEIPLDEAVLESPLPDQPDASAAVIQGTLSSLRGLQVLVIDDNLMNLKVLERSLSRAGMRVQVTTRADQGVELLRRAPVDVVLMDLYMPEINGVEATRLIRTTPALSRIPVIAVSASVTPEEQENCRQAGMDGFVAKPVRLDRLSAEIARVMGLGRAP